MGQRVVVHYAGWLTDGKSFDSSYARGLPMTFRLGEVIAGWNEGLREMKPGGEAILVIPSALGYGARGAGAAIPPNADLVFRVELLEVKK
jgi:FKBP-type peptidyl-prolyl cis-trans isomerase